MIHPEALRELARQRHEAYQQEAARSRRIRELNAANHEVRPERFDVRHLRWLLLRPHGA